MATVATTPTALDELASVPLAIQLRVREVFVRLESWPDVSGARPLRGNLKGNWRIRTGDYRVIFRVSAVGQHITVWKIGYRGDVYD